VSALPVQSPDDDVDAIPASIGQSGGERSGTSGRRPRAALQRLEEVPDRFLGVPMRLSFGQRKPTPGGDLPVVDPPKSSGGQRMESPRRQEEKVRGLRQVFLRQDRSQALKQRNAFARGRLRLQVDFQMGVRIGPIAAPSVRPGARNRLLEDRDRADEIRGRKRRRLRRRSCHGPVEGKRGKTLCPPRDDVI
jgi:hypothetical protein